MCCDLRYQSELERKGYRGKWVSRTMAPQARLL
jgi:hypothetical protein